MPRQRHGRRHSVVSYDTGVKPPKPGVSRYGLIDFTLPIPSPPRPYPLSARVELLCAVGVVPSTVYPNSGRIYELARRQGRLRPGMRDVRGFLPPCSHIGADLSTAATGPLRGSLLGLTAALKATCMRGDGSRSGPRPPTAIRSQESTC